MTGTDAARRQRRRTVERALRDEHKVMPTGHVTADVLTEVMVGRWAGRRGELTLERSSAQCARLNDDPWGAGPDAESRDRGRGAENGRWLARSLPPVGAVPGRGP